MVGVKDTCKRRRTKGSNWWGWCVTTDQIVRGELIQALKVWAFTKMVTLKLAIAVYEPVFFLPHDFLPYSFFFFFFFFVFCVFRASHMAYGGSQARGIIRAVAASLRQSCSNARSEPCLWPTPQLTAMLDPQPTERGQGSNLQPHSS